MYYLTRFLFAFRHIYSDFLIQYLLHPAFVMSFPFEIVDLEENMNKELSSCFPGQKNGFVQAGPQRYVFPVKFRQHADEIYNLKLRSDDVFVQTFPRSGTTMMQEMVWLIANDLNFEEALNKHILQRSVSQEKHILVSDAWFQGTLDLCSGDAAKAANVQAYARSPIPILESLQSPRIIKSHISLSLLSPALLDTCKVVYSARNPKDVAVSMFHFCRSHSILDFNGDFPKFWSYFQRNLVCFCPYWEHLRSAWENREHPNMLFLFYEDTVQDMDDTIRKVAAHVNKKLSEEDVDKVKQYLQIDNMRNSFNATVKSREIPRFNIKGEQEFIRKGKNNGWMDYFTPEMNASADKWIEENLKLIPGLKFPEVVQKTN